MIESLQLCDDLRDPSLSDDEPTSEGMGAEDPEPIESIDPDDYVHVQFAGKRSHTYYVGRVVSVDRAPLNSYTLCS